VQGGLFFCKFHAEEENKMQKHRAWVHGASKGIGFAVAECLARQGVLVTISSSNAENLKTAVEEMRKKDFQVSSVVCDLSEEKSIRQAAKEVGTADILFLNSGGPEKGAPLDLSLEDWDNGYQLVLRSNILLSQLMVPGMKKNGWGRIIHLTSTSAKEIIPGLPISSVFRSALSAWTKELSRQVGVDGILVNNILPGPTLTYRLTELGESNPRFLEHMREKTASAGTNTLVTKRKK
jgi:3-oxoacyl-[acyl-carrier protein] reductase